LGSTSRRLWLSRNNRQIRNLAPDESRHNFVRRARLLAVLFTAPLFARSEDLVLTIPPVRTSLIVQNQPVAVIVSGSVSGAAADHNTVAFHLNLTADLSDLQQNMTALLAAQLNRSEKCGERLTIDRALLAPQVPAALLTANLHYEKWACARVFGKEVVKRLVGGNGVVKVRLSPAVEAGHAIRLQSDLESIRADGSLGESLRSGSLGPALREKIRATLASAMDKANLQAAIPAALQPVAAVEGAQFTDRAGRLCLDLSGEVRISPAQLRALIDQRRPGASR
jgi:hypothetical protein